MNITDEQLAELRDYGEATAFLASRQVALAAVEEIEALRKRTTILRRIIKRAISPQWWARLSYPDREWWSDEEREELKESIR